MNDLPHDNSQCSLACKALCPMRHLLWFFGILFLQACATPSDPLDDFEAPKPTTIVDAPPATKQAEGYAPEQADKGKYLVESLGCGSCHTDGALVGEPNSSRRLAGSRVALAYSTPLEKKNPGVLYPANLTPDAKTGIGAWSDAALPTVIRHGVDRYGRKRLTVMGNKAKEMYVHFGVYQSLR